MNEQAENLRDVIVEVLGAASDSETKELHQAITTMAEAVMHGCRTGLLSPEWSETISRWARNIRRTSRHSEDWDALVREWERIDSHLHKVAHYESSESSKPDDEAITLNRVLSAMDSNHSRIIAIAGKNDLTAEEKLQAISRLDQRFYGKESEELGTLLGVSGAAIRRLNWWKVDRQKHLRDD